MSTPALPIPGHISPWRRLNLRWNPFGEPPAGEVAPLVVLPEGARWLSPLRQPRQALQFLGDAGRGKTARLRILAAHFPEAPYLYLPEDPPRPRLPPLRKPPAGGPVLLLDEAERLPRWRRWQLFRQIAREDASLVVAGHRDLTAEMERGGLQVTTEVVAGLDGEALRAIVERRLEWARAAPGPLPILGPGLTEALRRRFGDDLRGILDHLYEVYQRRLECKEEDDRWPSVT